MNEKLIIISELLSSSKKKIANYTEMPPQISTKSSKKKK